MSDHNDDAELEQDVLKLQIHSIPLNLNWNQDEEEFDDESEDDSVVQTPLSPAYDSQEEYVSGDEELIDLSSDFSPTPLNLLKLNFAYQEVIEQQIAMIDRLLKENHCKKSVLIEGLGRTRPHTEKPPRLEAGLFNKLLFKDDRGMGPSNPDLERIESEVGPGFLPNFVPPPKWKKQTDECLIAGIEGEAQRMLMEPLLVQLEYLQQKVALSSSEEETNKLHSKIEEAKEKIDQVKKMPREELLDNRDKNWDWESLSSMCLDGQQDPWNCALRWKNVLHPSNNHKAWGKEEDQKLLSILHKKKQYDWREVSQQLGTNRSVFDIVRRYQLHLNTSFKSRPWTPEEDAKLLELVEKLRVGNVVPYTQIALYMKNRSATQIVHRWTKSLDPSIKRSRFTPQEDAALLRAVKLHGPKWSRIRDLCLLPGRSDSQLRERYHNVLGKTLRSSWNREEDLHLIRMVEKHGEGNWTEIAAEMKDRADCQCLRRWNALKSYVSSGSTVHYRKGSSKFRDISLVRQNLKEAIEAEPGVQQLDSIDEEQSNDGSSAVMKVYDDLASSRARLDTGRRPRRQKSAEELAVDDELRRISALNINAERTLETIKRKSRRMEKGLPPKNVSGDHEQSSSASSSKSFTRNLYLPLCAPNRATVAAYQTLTKDHDRLVTRVKDILQLEEQQEDKFQPEELLAQLRGSYKYKIFRSRFNSLFTWPTLLSSLVPFLRRADGVLHSTVPRKRAPYIKFGQPPVKRVKLE